MDMDTFVHNEYHGVWLPIGVVAYNKVKPRGGSNAADADEIFRSFLVCSCDQKTGHVPLFPIELDSYGNQEKSDKKTYIATREFLPRSNNIFC